MKSFISICKIFSLCFFVAYVFSSCSKYLVVNGGENVPKKVVARITAYDIGSSHLTLVDDFGHSLDTFSAWPGQKIKWKIEVSGVHISNITATAVSKNNDDVFEKKPHSVSLSTSWEAKIKDPSFFPSTFYKDSLTGKINYDYNIVWLKDNDTTHRTFDPRIQINY